METWSADLHSFKKCGKNVQIGDSVLFINPENIEIGDNVRIDDFVKIVSGKKTKIGNYVHISSFCSIIGGGTFIMEDYSTFSCGCRIITGTDDYSGDAMTNPMVPSKYTNITRGTVVMGKHCILGTNTIIHPNVVLGDGTATGSFTLVNKNLEPWNIWIGIPAKKLKRRKKSIIFKMEKELENDTAI